MTLLRSAILLATTGLAVCAGGAPASAQFYLKSPTIESSPVDGSEPGITTPLPGATPAEQQAGLVWTLRAALNVAALQCQFEPSLLTVQNYNSVLTDHDAELKASYDTLAKYFQRVNTTKAAGQSALDQFGTRTYASFSTVGAQYGFCQTASSVGGAAMQAPRGGLATVAKDRLRQLRNSLLPTGEMMFHRLNYVAPSPMPRLDDMCWRKDDYVEKKCGVFAMGQAASAPVMAAK